MGAAHQLMLVGYVDHIEEAAIERDRRRPDVYAEFVRLALGLQASGIVEGAKAIAERIRWGRRVERGDRDFVVNNDDPACWARWATRDHAELRGYFSFRVRTAR